MALDQMGGMGDMGGDEPQMLTPVDHDPFDDPESVKAILTQIAMTEQRIYSVEMTISQAVQVMTQALAQLGQAVAQMRDENARLRQTMLAPKLLKRDSQGRLLGVVIDPSGLGAS